MTEPPFCGDPGSRRAFDLWRTRLEALGIEVLPADTYVVGLLASREARLEELQEALRSEHDRGQRLRLVAAERLAAADMSRALDQLERVFGASVGESESLAEVATGTEGGRVIPFNRGLSPVAQRIVAAVAKASGPLTREALRRRVSGSKNAFLRGLREVVSFGAVARSGAGRRGSPHTYRRA